MATPLEVAWFAGLFEGEGCISIERNGSVGLTIRMTDRDVIERVHALFPANKIGIVHPKPRLPHHNQPQPQFSWRTRHPETVRDIITMILPYLGERRSSKARAVLNHLDSRPGTGSTQRARTHCPQGHEYNPENTYVNPSNGNRHCRVCRSEWAATRRIEHRDEINARRRKPGGRGPYKQRSLP